MVTTLQLHTHIFMASGWVFVKGTKSRMLEHRRHASKCSIVYAYKSIHDHYQFAPALTGLRGFCLHFLNTRFGYFLHEPWWYLKSSIVAVSKIGLGPWPCMLVCNGQISPDESFSIVLWSVTRGAKLTAKVKSVESQIMADNQKRSCQRLTTTNSLLSPSIIFAATNIDSSSSSLFWP